MQEEGLTNEGRHHLLLLHKQAHDKRGIAESLRAQITRVKLTACEVGVASFPGSPRANEKSKERGEPGRIYHVKNVIGRENLITSGQTNELAHALWLLVRLRKLYGRQNGTRPHYATLPGSTASYGKRFQSVHSKITLTYSLT